MVRESRQKGKYIGLAFCVWGHEHVQRTAQRGMEDGGMNDTHTTHTHRVREEKREKSVRQTGREKKKGTRACIGQWSKCTWEVRLRKSEERRRNRKKHHFITVHVGNKKISAHWSLPTEITEVTEMRTLHITNQKNERVRSK